MDHCETCGSIERAKRTSRSAGAVGSNPLVYRKFRELYEKENDRDQFKVLDFGAGRDAAHSKKLQDEGYDVMPHDWHFPKSTALDFYYDVVLVSNVLNVQDDLEILKRTIYQIINATAPDGHIIMNYPSSPRFLDLSTDRMERRFRVHGYTLKRVGGTPTAPVWEAVRTGVTHRG